MFTGIIEEVATIHHLEKENENLHLTIKASFTSELKIDQSVAHNGVCLTVVEIQDDLFKVTAIKETLLKTNLAHFKVGDTVNLERGMILGERLDGHLVQGHVDQVGTCIEKTSQDGSHLFTFEYDDDLGNITIEKGSITINGVSLTVVNSKKNSFSVAIIPYTLAHTTFNTLSVGDQVNLEFDVIGKYAKKLYQK
ncbi:riboflavin synthase [Mesonia aestuariivivens]|uniref:Riboflavin synthase n=1 Tax=Mesonia aestuariivivens TaxID=2796128 RepID=A0ABS6W162_9FLAO|nr:riboflavin synthase [Mesonia aestuariivivens]MBW2961598.1 riboflavin synthase [Mesonia aestuariivivens]